MVKVLKKDLNLIDTLFSGQCFRAFKEKNGFIIIISDRVLYIEEDDKFLIVKSDNEENLESVIINYFDLNRDYKLINDFLSSRDPYMKNIIKKCTGYKILNQSPFEMYISFIISQNNNVKRISTAVEKIAEKYGKKVFFENKEYYLFPDFNSVSNVNEKDLDEFNLGYRKEYILNAINKLKDDNNFLNKIEHLNTENALNELLKIKGIGLKVASCILLFGFNRFDAFPIDTWVKKNVQNNYDVKNDIESIKKFAFETYGDYCGLAIQYMFHSERNKK